MKSRLKTILFLGVLLLEILNVGYAQVFGKMIQAPPVENVLFTNTKQVAYKKPVSGLFSDTLWYTFIKHYYRNPAPANVNGYGNLDYPSSQGIGNPLTGSLFQNPGTLTVTGLEVLCFRRASSPSANVPVKLYLCNVNSGGFPLLPAVDSVLAYVSGNTSQAVGGDFTTPRTMTSNFAVLANNASTVAGDTILLFFNNAQTATSAGPNTNAKYGEGLGLGRPPGSPFIKLTNLFGQGTDYETLVAARVSFSTQASVSAPSVEACLTAQQSYSNNSSPYFSHRIYNKNEFYRFWSPFGYANTVSEIKPDSVFVWNFGDGSGEEKNHSKIVNHSFSVAGNYNCTLVANYQPTRTYPTISQKLTNQFTFQVSSKDCNNLTGMNTNDEDRQILLYPNPMNNGQTLLTGLSKKTEIKVYDRMHRLVISEETQGDTFLIDLSTEPQGIYFVNIKSVGRFDHTTKLVR